MSHEKWFIRPGESRVIDTGIIRSLKVALIGGQVDVIGHNEETARVEVNEVAGQDLKVRIDGDRLEIDHPQLRWENFLQTFRLFRPGRERAIVSVLVPRDVELTFGVVDADALVAGLTTDAKLSTISGEIQTDSLTGDLELNAVSGDLNVQNHTGDIGVHTVSGDVTASGRISDFSCDTVSGNVFIDASGSCDRIRLNSMSGDLTARIDEEVGARYSINTVSGRVYLDGNRVVTSLGRGYSLTVPGEGNQVTEVSANTVSGDVSVIRRTEAESFTVSSDGTAQ